MKEQTHVNANLVLFKLDNFVFNEDNRLLVMTLQNVALVHTLIQVVRLVWLVQLDV